MKDISFIIPVYNTPVDKLDRCINSILKLKKKFNIEIIVIDDGSKENIEAFFRDKSDEDIIYRRKTNGGVSSARNMGLDIAEGMFIFFADSDDVILDDPFESISLSDKYQLFIFDIDVIENDKKNTWKVLNRKQGEVHKKDIVAELVTSNRMNSPCSKLFLNRCIKENNIKFDEKMVTGEDMNFVLDFTEFVSAAYYTGESAYCYQREETSRIARINNFPDVYFNNVSFLRNKLEGLIEEYSFDKKYISLLNIDHVESLYNYASDLMTLGVFTIDRKRRVVDAVNSLTINCDGISRKKLMKYRLLHHKNWAVIFVLAYIRKYYLKLK